MSPRFRLALTAALLASLALSRVHPARAQDAEAVRTPTAEAPAERPRPKVVIVVTGDPDPMLVTAAVELEAALDGSSVVRLPADSSLRSALRGAERPPSAEDDGLAEVRADRRRLSGVDDHDAPILARLGERAAATLVLAIRERSGSGPELLALDVGSGRFFEGTLDLAQISRDAVVRYVSRRAERAGQLSPEAAAVAAQPQAPQPSAPEQPDWFGQNWPYLAAGVLLAAGVAFVIVIATEGDDPAPTFRFQPPN